MAKLQRILTTVVIAFALWAALPARSLAQLDASCMVSAFNRTAPVQADGVWVLPNVPANLGQVRVRATCVEDGVVRFGASSLINVPADGVLKIEDIDFQGPPPVPSSLSLSAPFTVLVAVGQTVPISAVVTYPGGSTADVTAGETGTDYRVSNPAIAAIDANGVVTARASGVALVSAVHEGALGVIRIQVVTSGDSDGDGLPDDWELANGLDPNNPVDALDDQDEDGLSTVTEYLGGLNPFNGDSDGDGLKDGREVNELGTNALLADTDGDGLRDGLEVQTQSDPLDAESFNLAAALQSIEVAPGSFRILFNTVFGEASRQLRVTGRLIDGFPLDITSRRYGTAYGSSDLTVAGFGSEDGRIYAGRNGAATVSIGNSGFSASAHVTVETFSPRALSYVRIPAYPKNVALSGDFAFVATDRGVYGVDVSNPLTPFIVSFVATRGYAEDVRIAGDFAFVADSEAGLMVLDISQPQVPRIVATRATASQASDLVVTGGKAFVADGEDLAIFDVSDPVQPVLLGSVPTPRWAQGVDVVDGLAVMAAGEGGVLVVDVRDVAHPVVLGSTATRSDGTSAAADVVLRDRLAYVADGADFSLGGLRVIDFRDPANPVVIGTTSDRFALTSTALERGLAFSSDNFFVNAVPIFDSAAGNPGFRAVLDFSGPPGFRDDHGQGLAVRDGLVYLAAQGVYRDPAGGALHIGRYAILEDTGALPPVVTMTAPSPEVRVSERRRLLLSADARDDVRVASVQFLVNGQVAFTDFDAPYEYSLSVPAVSTVRLGALATDDGGNQAYAPEVVLPVDPNSAPVAAFLAPVAGQTVTEGTEAAIAVEATDDHAVTKVEIYVNGILRSTDTVPPYRYNHPIPAGAAQLSVSAIAYDDAGPSETAGPAVVTVRPDQLPVAEVIQPRDGQEFVEGSYVQIVAGASDDAGIRTVSFFANDERIGVLTAAPAYFWYVNAPAPGDTLRLRVVAEDTRHQQQSSSEVVITGVPDLLTTVRGRTVDATGHPLVGAQVYAGDLRTLSGVEGEFSFVDYPTIGDFSFSASAVVNGFVLQGFLTSPVPPVPAGITEIGDLVLIPEDPGTTVAGQILDETGSPVVGATVKVYDSFLVLETASGADGRFTVAGAPSQGALSVSASVTVDGVRLRGHAEVFPVQGEVTDVGTVTVLPVDDSAVFYSTIIGRVVSGGGVAGARVNVSTPFEVFSTVTAGDGTYSIPGVPLTDGDLSVAASAVIDGVLKTGSRTDVSANLEDTVDLGTIYLSDGSGESFQ